MASDSELWSIRQVVVHKNTPYAKERWELRGGANAFGRNVKMYFGTKKEASEKAKELRDEFRSHGSKATQLSDVQRADAAKAILLLGTESLSLVAAVDFYLKHGPKKKSCDVKSAVVRFLETRGVSKKEFENPRKHRIPEARLKTYKGYSWKHRVNITSRLRKFVTKWGVEPISVLGLKRIELQAWLQDEFGTKIVALDNHRRTIHSLFDWAKSQDLASENPAKRWPELSKLLKNDKKRKKPGIVAVPQLHALLCAAMKDDPQILPFIVIAAFSGIRTEELDGLTWGMIRDEIIHIPALLSKTNDARDIKIHPTLRAWLKIIPRGGVDARIGPKDFGKRRALLCKQINLKWPTNALRHSFGSYRYADTGDIAATAFEMRHEDPSTFKQHYLNRGISKDSAHKYWSLRPMECITITEE